MAKISLRSYNQEIENLINRGESEEAITHCKYILKLFPKHIDTYRLLGKAYLENQRYTEASDILKRVLSVIPDDFISQIGLSIIREDEGNLDAAIWHMERAFEVQPSNAAIQEELRRLYGKRDGLQPHRVRLTRGALVRMYAKGELYPQAIAEARAALAEDPQRTDLMIVLARCYHLSGQDVEATEVCSRLLSKLPFCFEANRILAQILPNTSKADDAKTYQQRVSALDPYFGLTSPNAPTSEQVPDNAVTIERLVWKPSPDSSTQPDWAQSVGVDLAEEQVETPNWMSAIPTTETLNPLASPDVPDSPEIVVEETASPVNPVEVEAPATQEDIPEIEASIPDWMQDAGWTKSDTDEAGQPEIAAEELQADAGIFEADEIVQDEIPDWIKSMAPEEADEDVQFLDEEENLSMLEKLLPLELKDGQDGTQNSILNEADKFLDKEEIRTSWNSENVDEGALPPSELREVVESADGVEDTQPEEELAQIPDWLVDFSEDASESMEEGFVLEGSDELPDWLKTLSDEATETRPEPEEKSDTEAFEVEEDRAPSPTEGEWLESLIEEQGSEEEPPIATPTGELPQQPPAWIFESSLSAEASEDRNEPTDDPISAMHFGGEAEPEASEEDHPAASLQDAQKDDREAIDGEPEKSSAEHPLEAQQLEELNEGFAWLESLAAKQGADAETLLLKPEDRMEEIPDWIKGLSEAEPTGETTSEPQYDLDADTPTPSGVVDGTDRWVREFESTSESVPFEEEEAQLSQTAVSPPNVESSISAEGEENEIQQTERGEPDQTIIPENKDLNPRTDILSQIKEIPSGERPLTDDILREWGRFLPDSLPPALSLEPKPTKSHEIQQISPAQETIQEEVVNIQKMESIPSSEEQEDMQVAAAERGEPFVSEEEERELEQNEIPSDVEPDHIPANLSSEDISESGTAAFDGEDVFAWLESLAKKQGADEETLLTRPEDRSETPPDWLSEVAFQTDSSDEAPLEKKEFAAEKLGEIEKVITSPPDPSMEDTQEMVTRGWSDNSSEPEESERETGADQLVQSDDENKSKNEFEQNLEHLDEDTKTIPDWLEGVEGEISSYPQPIAGEISETSESEESAGISKDAFSGIYEFSDINAKDSETVEWEEISSSPYPAESAPATGIPPVSEEIGRTESVSQLLSSANQALNNQDIDGAAAAFSEAIREQHDLDEIIENLNRAVYRFPVESALWLAMGDAYSQNGEIQKALDAYSKGEELLQ